MASPLDFFFGSKVQIPNAVTVDPNQAATTAQGINAAGTNSATSAFGSYAPQLTSLIQNLFNNAYPQVGQALNTNSSLGTQLATTGSTSAANNAMAYYRQLGLQTAGATGAPISSAFAQNLGGSLGAQQIIQNQQAGSGILSGVAQQGGQLGMQMLQPALNTFGSNLQSNLTTPGQVMSTQANNASMQNQQNVLQAQYNSQANPAGAWMVNEMATIFNTLLGSASGAASGAGGGGGGMGAMAALM